jgi:hypothetical protein
MPYENEATESTDRSCEFGVFGGILRSLQNEELDLEKACTSKTPETIATPNVIDLLKEINLTLKEISDTQKDILKEIKKNEVK